MHTDKLKYAVYFNGSLIGTTGQRIVEGKVLLELEAFRCLDSVHKAQLPVGIRMTMEMNQRLNGPFIINPC